MRMVIGCRLFLIPILIPWSLADASQWAVHLGHCTSIDTYLAWWKTDYRKVLLCGTFRDFYCLFWLTAGRKVNTKYNREFVENLVSPQVDDDMFVRTVSIVDTKSSLRNHLFCKFRCHILLRTLWNHAPPVVGENCKECLPWNCYMVAILLRDVWDWQQTEVAPKSRLSLQRRKHQHS